MDENLLAQVRAWQRANRHGRLQWHYFCDTYGERMDGSDDGIRNPAHYPCSFLKQFFHAVDAGRIPETLEDPHPGKTKKTAKPSECSCTFPSQPDDAARCGKYNSLDLKEPEVGKFVLLALFDGIRGCSVALHSLGLKPQADYSSEVDETCRALISAKFPECVQLGDVRKIHHCDLKAMVAKHGKNLPWLVVGGSPCQDLSRRRGKSARGLAGHKSKLFFEFVRIVNMLLQLGVEVAFVLENVSSMPDSDRDAMSAALGVKPLDIDAVLLSACHRQRYYWTNLPATEPQAQQIVDVDMFLDEGWRREPPGKAFRCLVASAAHQASRGRGELGVVRIADGFERALNADERESLMGFPRGHTRLLSDVGVEMLSESARWRLLGNSFSVQVFAHILEPIRRWEKEGKTWELNQLREDALVVRMDRILQNEVISKDVQSDIWLSWSDVLDE